MADDPIYPDPIFPWNNLTDEFYWTEKKTITSFNVEGSQCLSPFGPVSNMNCPKEDPTCNCPKAAQRLAPNVEITDAEGITFDENGWRTGWDTRTDVIFQRGVTLNSQLKEPTDVELTNASFYTYECAYLMDNSDFTFARQFAVEWLGVDFENPHSRYNCNYCNFYRVSNDARVGALTGAYEPINGVTSSWKPYFTTSNDPNTHYFNYDKRKTYDGKAYPPQVSLTAENIPGDTLGCNVINGQYFHYYKEYSKTAATFWNTPPKTPLYRRAQTALMAAQRIKILVNGDIRAKPGKLIYINYPNFGGRWMIYKVQRVITPQKHSMFLFLMRDGVR